MTDEAEAIVLRRAKASDIDDIAAIYRSCIGIAGTTWNEYYPLRRDAERDLAVNGLYVAEVGGTTVGCVSVIRSELEALAGWRGCAGTVFLNCRVLRSARTAEGTDTLRILFRL